MTATADAGTPAGRRRPTSLVAAAIVPSAPLLLPSVSPDQRTGLRAGVAHLRTVVARVLEPVAGGAALVLIAAGTRPGVHTRIRASLAPLGVRSTSLILPTDAALVDLLAADLPALDDDLDLDLSVLASLVAAHDTPTVAVTVPAGGDPDTLVAHADSILAATDMYAGPVAVVGAGDLSACRGETSPGHLHPDAVDWDDETLTAVRGHDTMALGKLGPDAAGDVAARSWAPLLVTCQLAWNAGLGTEHATLHAPLGVGYLVARLCRP